MKRVILIAFILIGVTSLNGQVTRPAGLPNPNSTGYAKYGYMQADSGYIWSNARDTFPAKFKTTIWASDGNFYKTLGNGAPWTLWVPKVAGTVSLVNTSAATGITGGPFTTTGTIGADTLTLTTRARTKQIADSIIGLIASSGGGTVINVSTTDMFGITSTVTDPSTVPNISLKVDTSHNNKGVMTWSDGTRRYDSLGRLKVNYTDTAAMVANLLRISDTAAMLAGETLDRVLANGNTSIRQATVGILIATDYVQTDSIRSGTNLGLNGSLTLKNQQPLMLRKAGGGVSINALSMSASDSLLMNISANPLVITGSVIKFNTNGSRQELPTNKSGIIALTSDINSGTVTSVSRADQYGFSSTISTPTTTPVIRGQVDTTVIVDKTYFNNIAVKYSDTASMLANRLKISDTAQMLSPYARISNLTTSPFQELTSGTITTVTPGANLSMPSGGVQSQTLSVTGAATAVTLTATSQIRVQQTTGGTTYARIQPGNFTIVNISGGTNAAILSASGLSLATGTITTSALTNTLTKMNSLGTMVAATAGVDYISPADTASMLSNLLRKTDTAQMLAPYARIANLVVSPFQELTTGNITTVTPNANLSITGTILAANLTSTGSIRVDAAAGLGFATSIQPGGLTVYNPSSGNATISRITTTGVQTTGTILGGSISSSGAVVGTTISSTGSVLSNTLSVTGAATINTITTTSIAKSGGLSTQYFAANGTIQTISTGTTSPFQELVTGNITSVTSGANLSMTGQMSAFKYTNNGTTSYNTGLGSGTHQLFATTTGGATLGGNGSTNDITLLNSSNNTYIDFSHGSLDMTHRGNIYLNKSIPIFTIDGRAASNSGAQINLLGWTTSFKNWQISVAKATSGLDFIPSTVVGGNVFTGTQAASLSAAGDLTTASSVNTVALSATGSTQLNALTVTGGASVTGGLAATLTTAAQTNITSLGTLSSLNVSGTAAAGTLSVATVNANNINVAGNGTVTLAGTTPALVYNNAAGFAVTDGSGAFGFRSNLTTGNFTVLSGSMTAPSIIKTGGASTDALKADGSVTTLTSGTYTPSVLSSGTVNSPSASVAQYMRVGNTVTVSGSITATPQSTPSSCNVTISLPIASTFSQFYQLAGAGGYNGLTSSPLLARANTSNNGAFLEFYSINITADTYYYTFTYQVI